MESKRIEELNSKLEKMEQIMGNEGKNLSFDSIIVDCDHDYAVIKARKIAEGICRYVVIANRLIKDNNSIRNATLEVYLKQFMRTREDLFPRGIIINIETIQKYGNYGGHYQTGEEISENDVDICLSALITILNWFNDEYDMSALDKENVLKSEDLKVTIHEDNRKGDIKKDNIPVEEQVDESLTQENLINRIILLSQKYAYNIYERINTTEKYNLFCRLANKMFSNSVNIYNHGKKTEELENTVEYVYNQLRSGQRIIRVNGLPGAGKNMLLQLVFYRMINELELGSKLIPIYVSVNYYEKLVYQTGDVRLQVYNAMKKDIGFYLEYMTSHSEYEPVFFVDAVREHQISDIFVENVFSDLVKSLGKVRKLVSVDTGLVKNRSRIKKVIPLTVGDDGSCRIEFHQVAINNKIQAMEFIDCVLKMYEYEMSAGEIYEALKALKYSEIDIFLVRLLTKEMFHNMNYESVAIAEIYEKMALAEYLGDEQQLLYVSENIFKYVFDPAYVMSEREVIGQIWSLAHKHHSFMEFLIAYYFVNKVKNYRCEDGYEFFSVMLTAMANQFVASFLKSDYSLQETMVSFVNEKYITFNTQQKSNAAYWMGRITYKNLSNTAMTFLTSEFSKLKMLVKTNNKNNQENLDNHFLFRSVCTGLLLHGQANMMDEYLCVVITNDIANALNRGATIEYFGNAFQIAAHNTYYLDTDINIGERAIIVLDERIEGALYRRNGKFVENNLVTMLTILQARIQNKSKKLRFDISPYVKKAIEYLNVYKTKPQNVASSKILMYFESIKEDLERYLSEAQFDVGPLVYNKYRGLKDVKRTQWLARDIYDPESVSEHSFSAWLMAALFLPEEHNVDGYIKKEILDMILIHDMAEAELGDRVLSLNEPTKELEEQNYIMKKLFLKGTYPDIANLTYYYNVWTGYYNCLNINAKVARDVNLVQTVYTFLEYYSKYENQFRDSDLESWMAEKDNLITDIGYDLFERLILGNSDFVKILSKRKNN